MKRFAISVLALVSSACSTMGDVVGKPSGFTEAAMSGDRYRIAYVAQDEATAKKVSDRTLSRAAQLTLDKGEEWFEIQSKVDGKFDGHITQTLVIVMGSGDSLAGGPKQYDAKQTLASLKAKIS